MSGPFALLCTGTEILADVVADAMAAGWRVLAHSLALSSREELLTRVRHGARDLRALRAVLPFHPSSARQVRMAEWMLGLAWRAYRASRRAAAAPSVPLAAVQQDKPR